MSAPSSASTQTVSTSSVLFEHRSITADSNLLAICGDLKDVFRSYLYLRQSLLALPGQSQPDPALYIQRHFSRNYKQGSRCHQAQVSSEVVPCDWIFDVEDSIYRYLHLPMWHASYCKCASCEVSWHGTGMVLSSLAVDACLKINRTTPHHSIICIEKNKQEARSCVLLY